MQTIACRRHQRHHRRHVGRALRCSDEHIWRAMCPLAEVFPANAVKQRVPQMVCHHPQHQRCIHAASNCLPSDVRSPSSHPTHLPRFQTYGLHIAGWITPSACLPSSPAASPAVSGFSTTCGNVVLCSFGKIVTFREGAAASGASHPNAACKSAAVDCGSTRPRNPRRYSVGDCKNENDGAKSLGRAGDAASSAQRARRFHLRLVQVAAHRDANAAVSCAQRLLCALPQHGGHVRISARAITESKHRLRCNFVFLLIQQNY
jgi:hypothetical protein